MVSWDLARKYGDNILVRELERFEAWISGLSQKNDDVILAPSMNFCELWGSFSTVVKNELFPIDGSISPTAKRTWVWDRTLCRQKHPESSGQLVGSKATNKSKTCEHFGCLTKKNTDENSNNGFAHFYLEKESVKPVWSLSLFGWQTGYCDAFLIAWYLST